MWLFIVLTLVLSQSQKAGTTNHYALKDDGIIKRRLDSPFHLRQPDNLYSFIEQIRYTESAEEAFRKMQRKRSTLDDHIVITDQLLQIILERSKCVRMYVKMTGLSDYLRTTGASMKRLKFPEKLETRKESKGVDPICRDYAELQTSRDKYAHLKSFKADTLKTLSIEREENLLKQEVGLKDAESVTETIHEISVKGLANNPTSWKFHMLGSYYWRLTGHAKNALDCARLSVMLAPEESKDIPLLSLGTILVRAKLWDDAETILNEAIKYGPKHGENYIALATLLALKHDFKRARENFHMAEKLDVSMFNNSLKMRQYIECLEPLDTDATKLFGFVKYMLREIKEVSKLRQEISQYQNKIIQQQTPLASRFTDNDPQLKADLLKRFQYCSTRKSTENQEPVLFCDFYSDLQMQLESKQFDAELLDWQVNRYISHLFEKFPFEYKKQLEILYNNVKAVSPTKLGVYSM
ncbi:tetratricopeptide repeat protein 17-like [Lucilia sericata]|uniref:tetratricopeptide repeat protein 17-like n=1 Tax=Lucilia sericata TaxID=13632 RepID=UPI0018A82C8A|nr:tetratricopeptide repeat protein 17-like [Lucilia sericata]XP_037824227.1 tetratricopeptide repeat protein 17-like [Lucilia sericata]